MITFKEYKKRTKGEKEDWFEKRTKKHISLVQKYCQKIYDYNPKKFDGLIERGKIHDQSKFENPEREPYIFLTWDYKCKDDNKKHEISDEMREEMNKATEHHVKNNKHHPEYHDSRKTNLINREDRDKILKNMINATKMSDLDISEMVADWCAMSDKRGGNPTEWANKNINTKWKFSKKQKDLIYELIDAVYDKR